jgi:hypothetical protein
VPEGLRCDAGFVDGAAPYPDPVTDPIARLRALCTALPEVTEKISHGEPTWFVKKVFVTLADHHHDDRLAFWCAAPPGVQEELVAAAPERFFRPPYVGGRGWLGVWLDVRVDWAEVAEIVTDAYLVIAPRRLAEEVRSRTAAPGPGTP